ncbi:hypothetical protein QF037_000573 [Streptomyces canus]|nr:hypothetical protein [Streptomyces canus]
MLAQSLALPYRFAGNYRLYEVRCYDVKGAMRLRTRK